MLGAGRLYQVRSAMRVSMQGRKSSGLVDKRMPTPQEMWAVCTLLRMATYVEDFK